MTNYLDLTKLFIRSLRINKLNKKGGKVLFYLLITILVLFVFLPILAIYTIFIYETMRKLNDVDMAIAGFEALLFIISVFSFVFGFNVLLNELYFSEDIDNILPLPVKPETIVASKFTSCFIVENVILFVFLLLGVAAYVFALKLPIYYILISLIGIIFLPMIPMVFCTLLLFIIISILKKFLKSTSIKKIGYVLLGILILVIVFILWKLSFFDFEAYIETFAAGDHTFLEIMSYVFPSINFFVKGLNEGSIVYMLLSVGINLLYFGIMIFAAKYLYYDSVVGIASKDTDSKKASHNLIKDFNVKQPTTSYFWKDIKIIFRSPTFLINCIIINVIWPIFVVLLFKTALANYTITYMRDAVINGDTTFYFRMLLFVIGIPIIITSFNSLASSAFSREGKNFHFIKYIPLKYGLQWRTKYFVSFIISFIGISIFMIPFFIIIHLPITNILLYIALVILCISFVSLIGLLIDSSFPKLIWDDEADSLRENYNTFIAMGYSLLLFVILCGGGYYLFSNNQISISQFTIATALILIIGNLLLYFIGRKRISNNIRNQESI
jgi:ABC-2 type transport system permease protein